MKSLRLSTGCCLSQTIAWLKYSPDGHVGTLTEVNRRLAAVAAFLAGKEV
jgi:hypothetical protein